MEIIFLLAALGLLACFAEVRTGLLICLLVGFAADIVRKVVPGQPVVLVAAVALFTGVVAAGEWQRGMPLRLPRVIARDPRLSQPLKLFGIVVLAETLVALVITRSAVIAGIGLLAYFAPIPAVLVGARFARRESDIPRFLNFYVLLATITVSGVYLSALGVKSRFLDAVGVEQVIYSPTVGEVRLLCGFLRSSENAAWHAATAVCFLILLWTSLKKRSAMNWLSLALVPVLMIAIPLTGRRKAFVTVVLFVVLYGALLAYFRRGATRLINVIVGVVAISSIFLGLLATSGTETTEFQPYFERGRTATGASAVDRLRQMTVDSFKYVIDQNGFLGRGAGTGSQGSQHFGGGADVVGYAAEGGLGKVLAELGVPGLVLLLWIGVAGVRSLARLLRVVNRGDPLRARLIFGTVAFLVANSVEFVTAHQIFGDPFVLLILGWVVGFLLALLERQLGTIRPAAVPRPELASSPVRSLAPARPFEGIPGL